MREMTDNDEPEGGGRHERNRHMASSDLAALLAEAFRATASWRTLRLLLVDGAKENGLNEAEVALRLLRALGWPPIDGDDDALELVATACCGDDELWWSVTSVQRFAEQ